MQVEVLKFLLDANAYLNDTRRASDDLPEAPIDLQAVDRALPDCDWFELVEREDVAGRSDELWKERITALEF